MEIPLKPKPGSAAAHSVAPRGFLASLAYAAPHVSRAATLPHLHADSDAIDDALGDGDTREGRNNYRLARTYSETETNNFDADTGHRMFDDGRIRTRPSRQPSPVRPAYFDGRSRDLTPKLYSRSHDEYIDRDLLNFTGLEDEYVPGLDFSDVLLRWTRPQNESTTTSHTNSREALYLDLNLLHAKVAPQPIQFKNPLFTKPAFSTGSTGTESPADPIKKKHKLSPKPEVNYEAVLASLPNNFNDLPYSQRMKLVKQFSESIDYSQFSLFAKNYHSDRVSSGLVGSGRTFRSDPASLNGSFIRKSRRNSANTVAGRLLALSLSLDLRKLEPKKNVDEKGAYVLDHQLGKVIGFGAWGTIRECAAVDGTIRAVKIVKSVKDTDRAGKVHNPKVLNVFRKEIEIWLQLDHPNILPLLDHLETEEAIFCLTNRINGGTLFEVVSRWGVFNEGVDSTSGPVMFQLDRQKTRLETTSNFAYQIASALVYMHKHLGIVHGDLKLENVLVDDLDPADVRMILCDFGMSRVYNPRLSRKLSLLDDATLMARSKSSAPSARRPYHGPDSFNTRALFSDDSKIGILHLRRTHGPSLQSLEFTPAHSNSSTLSEFHEYNTKDNKLGGEIESDLPHSHIGLLPYASPELLNPLPPPLGPSADIWALGVLVFTMIVGKLPFQHPYEPRLRAIITAGKYNRRESKQAALMEWLFPESTLEGSFVDLNRKHQIAKLKDEWDQISREQYAWIDDMIEGCLERDITKRWDLDAIVTALEAHCMEDE